MNLIRAIGGILVLAATLLPSAAAAQTLGTFHWQQQPYCNRLTLTVTAGGGVFTLDGFDDGCGAAVRTPCQRAATKPWAPVTHRR